MPGKGCVEFSLDPLDKKFVPPKPQNSVEDERVLDVARAGRAVFTRKRDGHYVSAVVSNGKAKIYSRGEVADLTDRFLHIARDLAELPLAKGGSLLCCELIKETDGRDDRDFVSRLARSSPAAAVELQETHGMARLMVFNALVAGGSDISASPNDMRIRLVRRLFSRRRLDYVFPVEVLQDTFEQAQWRVRENGWEGLVIYDGTKPSGYRLDGNEERPLRPAGCWKWKPLKEDDFIAYRWAYGTQGARHEHRMGKLYLAQMHTETGVRIPCGEVGIGFSDEERELFANDALYPCVVQVAYERRHKPKSIARGIAQCALCNPRYAHWLRGDKHPDACILPPDLADNPLIVSCSKGV